MKTNASEQDNLFSPDPVVEHMCLVICSEQASAHMAAWVLP